MKGCAGRFGASSTTTPELVQVANELWCAQPGKAGAWPHMVNEKAVQRWATDTKPFRERRSDLLQERAGIIPPNETG